MLGCKVIVFGAVMLLRSGSFATQPYVFGRADFQTGRTPYALVSADFSGDGILDIAASTAPSFWGTGTGVFVMTLTTLWT